MPPYGIMNNSSGRAFIKASILLKSSEIKICPIPNKSDVNIRKCFSFWNDFLKLFRNNTSYRNGPNIATDKTEKIGNEVMICLFACSF